MSTNPPRPLPHQRLHVWRKAVSLVEVCSNKPPNDAELRNHALRAAKSVALNIAEGAPLEGRSRSRFFHIARASVLEVAAAYELASAIGEDVPATEVAGKADEIYAMLTKLMRFGK